VFSAPLGKCATCDSRWVLGGMHCCCCFWLQVRCRTGVPFNNGRPLRISDLIYARPYQIKDNFGQDWPGALTRPTRVAPDGVHTAWPLWG
jgi:hypothetical protein